jgi:hypothetical protein
VVVSSGFFIHVLRAALECLYSHVNWGSTKALQKTFTGRGVFLVLYLRGSLRIHRTSVGWNSEASFMSRLSVFQSYYFLI